MDVDVDRTIEEACYVLTICIVGASESLFLSFVVASCCFYHRLFQAQLYTRSLRPLRSRTCPTLDSSVFLLTRIDLSLDYTSYLLGEAFVFLE